MCTCSLQNLSRESWRPPIIHVRYQGMCSYPRICEENVCFHDSNRRCWLFFFIWYKLAHTTSHDRFFFQKVAFRKGHPLIWGNVQVGDSFICFQSCIWKLVILLENSVRKPQGRTIGWVPLLPSVMYSWSFLWNKNISNLWFLWVIPFIMGVWNDMHNTCGHKTSKTVFSTPSPSDCLFLG